MTISSRTAALAAGALLALTLAGCAPTTTPDDAPTSDTSDTTDTTEESGAGGLVTLSGTGDYTVGVDAPIGGYELEGADTQPDGCTWAILDDGGATQFADQGIVVFLTEENASFQTAGCPDWVQFE